MNSLPVLPRLWRQSMSCLPVPLSLGKLLINFLCSLLQEGSSPVCSAMLGYSPVCSTMVGSSPVCSALVGSGLVFSAVVVCCQDLLFRLLCRGRRLLRPGGRFSRQLRHGGLLSGSGGRLLRRGYLLLQLLCRGGGLLSGSGGLLLHRGGPQFHPYCQICPGSLLCLGALPASPQSQVSP